VTTPTEPTVSPFLVAVPAAAAAYGAAMARIREAMAAFILRQFRLTGSYRTPDARAFVSVVIPIIQAAQQTVSTTTAAYLDRVTSEMTGTSRPPISVPPSEVTGAAVRKGVSPEVVYQRPYTQVWTDLAAGKPLEEAVRAGEQRALPLVQTDLQLTKTHTAKKVFEQDDRVVGYRRVPRGTHTCALCLIVSTRRYHKSQLAEVHPNCDCDVEPIHGTFDPGPVLDEDFLNAVHDAIERDLGSKYVAASGKAKNTRARELDYRDIIIVHEHGELGPVIGVRGQHFTGPEDVKRLTHAKIETE
jgi:hypothetical protein